MGSSLLLTVKSQWFARDKNWDKLRGDREYERMLAEVQSYADKYRQEFGASSF